MKLQSLMMASVLAALNLMAADGSSLLKTPKDKISYSIGMDIGRSITNQAIEINPEALAAGMKAVVSGGTPLMTEAEYQENMATFRKDMQAKMQARRAEMQAKQSEIQAKQAELAKGAGEKNKKDGEAFLAENKKKEGVKTTP